jgi:hypothetical protein
MYNNEWVLVLFLFILFWGAPLILGITALVKVKNLRKEVYFLRQNLRRTAANPQQTEAVITPPLPKTPPPPPKPAPEPEKPSEEDWEQIIATPPPGFSFNEVLVGGKLASFAGMGLVLIGVALLIGYAVRHAWFGPGARVLLGLITGAVCVALGHLAEIKGRQALHVLARSLTGGGAAIFYFVVFAAHSFYEIIPGPLAAAGLVLSAAATLGLAVAYQSQAVAVIGVLGAFLMPVFLDDLSDSRLFFLGYIALINLPVILLGLQRKWQALYNLAFGFTFFFVFMLAVGDPPRLRDGSALLLFGFVYFLQFTALGLIKLRRERDIRGRTGDIVRLLLNSLGFLGLLYHEFEALDLGAWTAAAMLGLSLLHIGFVKLGWKAFPAFQLDNLALLVGALTCASLALPVQLDGAWVSTGWAIMGVILCAFALKANIPLLQVAATLLGLLGLMKSITFDVRFYPSTPDLFLNARFFSGLISALLLGGQGWLHRRISPPDRAPTGTASPMLMILGLLGILLVFFADVFWTLGTRDSAAWLLSTLFLLITALATVPLARSEPSLVRFSLILFALIPLKLLLDLMIISSIGFPDGTSLFFNTVFLSLFVFSLLTLLASRELPRREPFSEPLEHALYATALQLSSLAAAILVVTTELYRINSDWSQTIVTVWWAACAMGLVLFGLFRNTRPHRRAGLTLFALTTGKVLLIDMSELEGLDRITGFLVAGVLLLILSYLYQKAATRLQEAVQ